MPDAGAGSVPLLGGAAVARLAHQAGESKDEDGLDQQHQAEQQTLSLADEGYGPDEDKHRSEDQRVHGEPEGYPGTAHTSPEAKAQRLSSGVPRNAVWACGLEPVELIPKVPVLIGHSPIIPESTGPVIRRSGGANLALGRSTPRAAGWLVAE